MYRNYTVAAVIPALNEATVIASVVSSIKSLVHNDQPLFDQIIVCDNASTDSTAEEASSAGADVVYEAEQGYGAACIKALQDVKADLTVFIDGDGSVNVKEVFSLLVEIDVGADLVIGSRFTGMMHKGAMPWHQRKGNHLIVKTLSLLLKNKFLNDQGFRESITDIGPFRIIQSSVLEKLAMKNKHYGWTIEMQMKAYMKKLVVKEVPVSLLNRVGHSKIGGTIKGTVLACLEIFLTMFVISVRYE